MHKRFPRNLGETANVHQGTRWGLRENNSRLPVQSSQAQEERNNENKEMVLPNEGNEVRREAGQLS
jgi:hypothetical protein